MAAPGYPKSGSFPQPPDYLHGVLEDAERLLKFASETGVDVPDEVRNHVLEARAASTAAWDESTASNLLTSLAKLAALLKPVTARSLEACSLEVGRVMGTYYHMAIFLAIIILPYSLASFFTSAIASTMRTDITAANNLAVKLRAKLGPPKPDFKNPDDPDVVADLQQYAAGVRAIDRRAVQLNHFLLGAEKDPNRDIRGDQKKMHNKFELPTGLPNFSMAASDVTTNYQDVRYFAQSLLDDASLYYGAFTVCVLPVLYALLGTCAYFLRKLAGEIAARTFTPYQTSDLAHFLVAGIGGVVVGLFNNFTVGQGASIPPLAIAFLVGYKVEVFFAFLDSMLQSFTKSSGTSAAAAREKN
jgi:hypothetical protein